MYEGLWTPWSADSVLPLYLLRHSLVLNDWLVDVISTQRQPPRVWCRLVPSSVDLKVCWKYASPTSPSYLEYWRKPGGRRLESPLCTTWSRTRNPQRCSEAENWPIQCINIPNVRNWSLYMDHRPAVLTGTLGRVVQDALGISCEPFMLLEAELEIEEDPHKGARGSANNADTLGCWE